MPGIGVTVIEVIVWLRFIMRSVSAQLGVSMPVPLIEWRAYSNWDWGQHVVGKLIARASWALVGRGLIQLGGLVYVLF